MVEDGRANYTGFDFLSTVSLWLGFSIYAGWVTAATILNVTLALNKHDVSDDEAWSVFVACFAALLYPAVAYLRRDAVYSTVGAWATFAISVEAGDTDFETTSTAFAVVAAWL